MTGYVFKIIVGPVFYAVFPNFGLFFAQFETSSGFASICLISKYQEFPKISYLPKGFSRQDIKIILTKIWFQSPYRLSVDRNLLVSYPCKISWHCKWRNTTYLWARARQIEHRTLYLGGGSEHLKTNHSKRNQSLTGYVF